MNVISQFKNEFQPSHSDNNELTDLVFHTFHANNISEIDGEEMHFQFHITENKKESYSFPDKYENLEYSKNPVNGFRGISSQSQFLPYIVEKTINGQPIWEDQLVLNKTQGKPKDRYVKRPCPLPSGWDRGRVLIQVYVNHNTKTVSFSHPLNTMQVRFERVDYESQNRYEGSGVLSQEIQRVDNIMPKKTQAVQRVKSFNTRL